MSGTELRVEVPPDVDVEDRVIGPLTFRHVGYLALAGGGAAVAVLHGTVPAVLFGAVLVVIGTAGAAWRPQGRPLDTWLLPARAYRERTRRGITAVAEILPAPTDSLVPPAPVEQPLIEPPVASTPELLRETRTRRVRLRRPALSLPRQRRPRMPPAHIVVATLLVAVAAAGALMVLPRAQGWPGRETPPVAVQRTAPPASPRSPSGGGAPPAPPHAHPIQPGPAPELSDQEVSDAVDAFFDWITGP